MCLPDLHGYWKYADVVVPFRLPLAPVRIVARGYIVREMMPIEIQLPSPPQVAVSEKLGAKAERPENREYEQAITEKQPEIVFGVNLSDAPSTFGRSEETPAEDDLTAPAERESTALATNAVDEELEQTVADI